MNYKRSINYHVRTEPEKNGLILVDLIKEDVKEGMSQRGVTTQAHKVDSFFVTPDDLHELEDYEAVMFYFNDLWREHIDRIGIGSDRPNIPANHERIRELLRKRYRVWNEDFFEAYDTGKFRDPETHFGDDVSEVAEPEDARKVYENDLDLNRVGYMDWGNKLFYPLGSETARSPAYFIDYINGVTSKDYHLDKAREILEADDRVLEVRDHSIPHYNGGGRALHFIVRLPQDEYDELVECCKKLDDKYFSVRIKEQFGGCVWVRKHADPLNLRPALKPEGR